MKNFNGSFYNLTQEQLELLLELKKANLFLNPTDSFNGEFWGPTDWDDQDDFDC